MKFLTSFVIIVFSFVLFNGCSSGGTSSSPKKQQIYLTYDGPQTGLEWTNITTLGKHVNNPTGPDIPKRLVTLNDLNCYGSICSNSIWLKIEIDRLDCFSWNNKNYFNENQCQIIDFEITHTIKNEKDVGPKINEFLSTYSKDICEDVKVNTFGSYDNYNIWRGHEPIFGEFQCTKAGKAKRIMDIALAKKKNQEKKKKEEEKKKKKLEKEKEEKELLQQSINEKKEVCKTMGFEEDTQEIANCVLQLTLLENKNNNSQTISTNDSQTNKQKQKELNLMQQQTNIMKKKLEQQQREYLLQQQELETQKKMLKIERQRQLDRANQIFKDIREGNF